jgi:hypothetical protein
VLDECRLHRVQLVGAAEPLDRHDAIAVVHGGKRQAGVDSAAVDVHRAGAALAVVTAFFRPGQPELFAQQIEQRTIRSTAQRPT